MFDCDTNGRKRMSEISVIVPVFNVEKYLTRCIESILKQTFSNFDLILVDDGSPDKSGAICDEYAKKDRRIHVIHQKNAGLSAARNSGIEWAFLHSNSQWLTFVDSDDWIHLEMLQRLYEAVCKTNLPVSICEYQETEGNVLEIDSSQIKTKIWKTEDFYLEKTANATVAWGKLYKKQCFENVRYPVGKLHEDEYITYKILFDYPKVAVVEAPLYVYFQNPEGIMHSGWTPQKLDALEAFEIQMKFFKKRNMQKIYKARVRAYINSATNQYRQCRVLSSRFRTALWLKCKIVIKVITYHKQKVLDKKTELYILEILFPHLMNCYWLMHALKNKLKNEGVGITITSALRHFRKNK